MASAPIAGPVYITLTALVESVDNVAATLTGSLDYLHGPRVADARPVRLAACVDSAQIYLHPPIVISE